MNLQITLAAANEIRRRFAASECESPVASFAGTSTAIKGDDELKKAVARGVPDTELVSQVERILSQNSEPTRIYLTVQVFDRQLVHSDDVCDIQGIPFVMKTWLRERLRDASLDYLHRGEFVLRAIDGMQIDLFEP